MFAMVLAAVKSGLGVGLLPRFLAQPELDRGELVAPFGEPLPVAQGYYFGYSSRGQPAPALQVFEQWLSDYGDHSFA
jgi:DNA-binding transcriptional LysR family regulator